jgi:hypothetical protein
VGAPCAAVPLPGVCSSANSSPRGGDRLALESWRR